MPSSFNKSITLLLLITAVALVGFSHFYRQNSTFHAVDTGTTWEFSHRGYPSHFGYLNHHWGLRVVEIQSQISVKTEKAIQAIAFKLYDSEQLIGEFTIQFDIHWQLKNRYFYGDVIESSIAITHVSDGLDIAPLERLLLDWIHDLYREPRELISRTPQQMIVDIPYIGITRTKLIPSPTLF